MIFRDEPITHPSSKPLCFQVLDWYQTDYEDEYDDESEDAYNNNKGLSNRVYIIKMFGVTKDGHSVCANIEGFKPFFYISGMDGELSPSKQSVLRSKIVRRMRKGMEDQFKMEVVYKKGIWGFTNNQKQQYIKFSFQNLTCMYIVRKFLKGTGDYMFHESNIDPFLRFVHAQDLQPCGWVRIEEAIDVMEEENSMLATKCQINVKAYHESVVPFDNNSVAPVIIMSFDIECTSHSGDFPVPIKTYRKTAEQMIEYCRKLQLQKDEQGRYDWLESKNKMHDAIMNIYISDETNVSPPLSRVVSKRKINKSKISKMIREEMDLMFEIMSGKYIDNEWENDEVPQTPLNQLERLLNKKLPPLEGDAIIQIGTTVHTYGETCCSYKNVITLDTCDDIPGVDVISCKTEKELIQTWCELLLRIDPDIITGYNILGFDFMYLYHRAEELGCEKMLLQCGRLENHQSKYVIKELASSALGENILKYVDMEGRVIIDLMKVVQREYKLDTYKLDNVASHFLSGKIKSTSACETNGHIHLTLDSSAGINQDDFIKLNKTHKCRVVSVSENNVITVDLTGVDQSLDVGTLSSWGLAKDDISPKQIFKCQQGSSKDRAMIAKYCVQDCALCNMLIIKLEVFANNMGMANVCLVPLTYIFMRGQGVKIFSLVMKQCSDDGFIVPVIRGEEPDESDPDNPQGGVGYEGAIVLDPIPGIYVDAPISVMDYASLYPSSMISENISHDSIVLDPKYDNLEGFEYVDITYDTYTGVGDKKVKTGETKCRYAQFPNNEKGILPRILMKLLSQRKSTRKKILHQTITTKTGEQYSGLVDDNQTECVVTLAKTGEKISVSKSDIESCVDTYTDFMKAVLDGLQLAYKITANSLYGQVGARTSPIYMKELAASTTATGRNLILKAKSFMEKYYDANVIYGDTDSIFVDFKIKKVFGLEGKEALQKSIDIAVEASAEFKKTLKKPHDLEYEKTFFPFIILSKKKYVGNLYEFDVNKYKQKSMGIVLKRRDNANILKLVYGGIIDILLNDQNIKKAIDFLKKALIDLVDGKYQLEDLVITKTLRSTYKDPTKIAHKVLVDRMLERDPGSAPQTNDRVPYVYIEHDVKNKSLLQGDKIEHPSYIIEKSLKVDYIFYITNQLMKPICQLLSVAIFDIPGCKQTVGEYERLLKKYTAEYDNNVKKAKDKISDLKQREVQRLLFDDIINRLNNKRNGQTDITKFFKII